MSPKKPLILVVEDDPALQKLVHKYLLQMDADVLIAADGQGAIEHLSRTIPDLVCLDLMLPHVSGYDVCETMKKTESLRRVPIMIMSSRTLPEDRAHAEEVGADAYLTKPFSRQQFSDQVQKLLQRNSASGVV